MKRVLTLVLVAAISLSFYAFKVLESKSTQFLQKLGIPEEFAKDCIWSSLSGMYLSHPGSARLRQVSTGERAAMTREIASYARSYTKSEEFKKKYLEYRDNRKPSPPEKPKPMAELKKEQKEQMKKSIKETEAAMKSMPAANLRRPVSERKTGNKKIAISFAAYRCLNDLFPSEVSTFDTLMASLGYDKNNTSTDKTKPEGIGNLVSAAVIQFRHNDGSNQLGNVPGGMHGVPYSDYTGYTPVNTPDKIKDPDHWQPLYISALDITQKFIAPHWGLVTPYAIDPNQFLSKTPAPASFYTDEQKYREQAKQVLEYSAHLTDEKKVIAEYWADGRAKRSEGHVEGRGLSSGIAQRCACVRPGARRRGQIGHTDAEKRHTRRRGRRERDAAVRRAVRRPAATRRP